MKSTRKLYLLPLQRGIHKGLQRYHLDMLLIVLFPFTFLNILVEYRVTYSLH